MERDVKIDMEIHDCKQDLFDAIQETRAAFAKRNLSLPISMTFSDPINDMKYKIMQSFRPLDFAYDIYGGQIDFRKGVKIMGMEIKIKGDHDADDFYSL